MADPILLDHYEILHRPDGTLWELGRGAMGITYKAVDVTLQSTVALKVINPSAINNETAHQRFLREARAAANIRHQNVATVFHLGESDGKFFYVMEYIDGETVDALVRRDGPFEPTIALKIAAQVARALTAAQKQQLIHRDIKPSNLMLVHEDGEPLVKVIDFGLARRSAGDVDSDDRTITLGGFLGTPYFSSPEQLDERELDIRSDIYSLGVTLFFMLTGRAPFEGSLAQVVRGHLQLPLPVENLPDSLPPEAKTLLLQMLEKDPADRIGEPSELRMALERCVAACGKSPTPPVEERIETPVTRIEEPRGESAGHDPEPFDGDEDDDSGPVELPEILRSPKLAIGLGAAIFGLILIAIIWSIPRGQAPAVTGVDRDPAQPAQTDPTAAETEPPTPEPTVAVERVSAVQRGRDLLADGEIDEAMRFFRQGADAGDPDAMAELAVMHARGEGTPQSWSEAIRWFTPAAEQGHPYATYALGECYYFGKGVPPDPQRALGYLEIAANEHDNFYAQVLLGDLMRSGELGSPDFAEALRLYLAASSSGSLDAEAKIGTMIFNGQVINDEAVAGLPRPELADHAAAFEIFRRGAAVNHPLSQYYYGRLLESGIGAPARDEDEGIRQIVLAAQAGEELAQEWCAARGIPFTDRSTPAVLAPPMESDAMSDADLLRESAPSAPDTREFPVD